MDEYLTAQRALADLKAAVLAVVRQAEEPLTNAEIGKSLGIYMGYEGGHPGHVSRVVLDLLRKEGLVDQVSPRGPWQAI